MSFVCKLNSHSANSLLSSHSFRQSHNHPKYHVYLIHSISFPNKVDKFTSYHAYLIHSQTNLINLLLCFPVGPQLPHPPTRQLATCTAAPGPHRADRARRSSGRSSPCPAEDIGRLPPRGTMAPTYRIFLVDAAGGTMDIDDIGYIGTVGR